MRWLRQGNRRWKGYFSPSITLVLVASILVTVSFFSPYPAHAITLNMVTTTADATVNALFGPSDPTVALSADKLIATPGDTVIVTLTVSNGGAGPASGVVITDSVPAQLQVASASAGQGTFTINGDTVIFTVGQVNSGQKIVLSIVTQASPSITPPVDAVNTAVLSYADGLNRDSNSLTVHITRGVLPDTGEHPDGADQVRLVLLGAAGVLSGSALWLRRKRQTTLR